MTPPLTHARLLSLLHYDPETGVFTRRVDVGRRADQKAGTVAGSLDSEGYVDVSIDGKHYRGNRLAWFYVHGAWPALEVDHRDTVRHHNWIKNLREATRSQNRQNQRVATRGSASGLLGAHRIGDSKKWRASIKIEGQSKHLGTFLTEQLAHEAYLAAKRLLHPFSTL